MQQYQDSKPIDIIQTFTIEKHMFKHHSIVCMPKMYDSLQISETVVIHIPSSQLEDG